VAEEFKSLKGQLLLDGGLLRGSFFHRAVVLICQHDREGAFGLVLNQTTPNKVGEVLDVDVPDSLKDTQLYLGGPVQPGALTYLHTDTFVPNANVIPKLNMGHSVNELMELSQSFSTTLQVRVFGGYAGWSPGQLDGEMARKTWLTHPASVDLVFHPQPMELWKVILRQKPDWRYRLMAEMPEDLSHN
jgi:putative transcriptional regulator